MSAVADIFVVFLLMVNVKVHADSDENCTSLLTAGKKTSDVYTINPRYRNGTIDVYCDMETDGGGWTVFQRRQDGSVDFYRGWEDYKNGFGNLSGEFWLGNDNIHRLCEGDMCELRVDMEDEFGESAYALYDSFSIGSESESYNLSIGAYSGDAGDSLGYHNARTFITKDRDNGKNCAQYYKGGWWYFRCHRVNLNGLYRTGGPSKGPDGVSWLSFKGHYYPMIKTTMKIRTSGFTTSDISSSTQSLTTTALSTTGILTTTLTNSPNSTSTASHSSSYHAPITKDTTTSSATTTHELTTIATTTTFATNSATDATSNTNNMSSGTTLTLHTIDENSTTVSNHNGNVTNPTKFDNTKTFETLTSTTTNPTFQKSTTNAASKSHSAKSSTSTTNIIDGNTTTVSYHNGNITNPTKLPNTKTLETLHSTTTNPAFTTSNTNVASTAESVKSSTLTTNIIDDNSTTVAHQNDTITYPNSAATTNTVNDQINSSSSMTSTIFDKTTTFTNNSPTVSTTTISENSTSFLFALNSTTRSFIYDNSTVSSLGTLTDTTTTTTTTTTGAAAASGTMVFANTSSVPILEIDSTTSSLTPFTIASNTITNPTSNSTTTNSANATYNATSLTTTPSSLVLVTEAYDTSNTTATTLTITTTQVASETIKNRTSETATTSAINLTTEALKIGNNTATSLTNSTIPTYTAMKANTKSPSSTTHMFRHNTATTNIPRDVNSTTSDREQRTATMPSDKTTSTSTTMLLPYEITQEPCTNQIPPMGKQIPQSETLDVKTIYHGDKLTTTVKCHGNTSLFLRLRVVYGCAVGDADAGFIWWDNFCIPRPRRRRPPRVTGPVVKRPQRTPAEAPAAPVIGGSQLVIIGAIITFIIFLDLSTICKHVEVMRRNLTGKRKNQKNTKRFPKKMIHHEKAPSNNCNNRTKNKPVFNLRKSSFNEDASTTQSKKAVKEISVTKIGSTLKGSFKITKTVISMSNEEQPSCSGIQETKRRLYGSRKVTPIGQSQVGRQIAGVEQFNARAGGRC